ncbi:MAG: hypothetical protein M5U15_13885 [Kiritimatiellae bacterium]|nr:hypothetical protein [Kiritimatiellia bacterium]
MEMIETGCGGAMVSERRRVTAPSSLSISAVTRHGPREGGATAIFTGMFNVSFGSNE